MRTSRTLTVSFLGVVVAGALGLGIAAPAQAVDWGLNGVSPKQMMINVLSSLLSGAMPDSSLGKARNAVITKDLQYDHSWEGIEAQFNANAAKGVPETYDQYVLDKQAYYTANNITSKQGDLGTAANASKYVNTKIKVPATKAQTFVKGAVGVGVGLVAVTAWDHRAEIGSGVASIVGVDDTTGAVCANSSYLDANGAQQFGAFQNWVTGVDCNAWQQAKNYVPNMDVVPVPDGWSGNNATAYNAQGNPFEVFSVEKTNLTYAAANNMIWTVYKAQGGENLANYVTAWCSTSLTIPTNPSGSSFNPSNAYAPGSGLPADVTAALTCQPGYKLVKVTFGFAPTNGSTVITWGAPGTSAYHPGVSSDPGRTATCTITGTDGNTYANTTTTPVKESSGSVPTPICPTLPDGVTAAQIGATENGGNSPQTIMPTTSTTPEFQAWWNNYPECHEGACKLDILRKTDNRSCFDDSSMWLACDGWFTDPNKVNDYQCMYGIHQVAITECNVYSNIFNPQKVASGQGYSDPRTGLSGGNQSSPAAMDKLTGRKLTDPQDYTSCVTGSWDSVAAFSIITCALQWAFAPPQADVTTATTAVKASWAGTPFAQVPTVLTNFGHIPVVTGCTGVPVNIDLTWPMPWGIHWAFGAACDDPLKSVATGVSTLLSALVYGGAALGFSWYIAPALGYRGFGRRSS